MMADRAFALYLKLAPHLEIVKEDGPAGLEPWGCYPPRRNGRVGLKEWPLHSWRGPGTSPLCIRWVSKSRRKPTFEQFCRVYRLHSIMDGDAS